MCETLQLNWKLPSSTATTSAKSPSQKKSKASKNYSLRDAPKKSKSVVSSERRTKAKKNGEKDAANKPPPKKRGPKPRPRPLPMSKYRRKAANLRERQRMGEINVAFDLLKSKIPELSNLGPPTDANKMTKINVLHVAINYIRALENILDTGDAGVNVFGTAVVKSPSSVDAIDVEVMEETAAPIKKKKKRSAKSKVVKQILDAIEFSSSKDADETGSDKDSGIMDEVGSPKSDPNMEDDLFDCPDWTELTSTLDFPHSNDPPLINNVKKTDMNTVLTDVSTARLSEDQIMKKVSALRPIFDVGNNNNVKFGPQKDLFRQSSFPNLGQEDLGCFFNEDEDLGFSSIEDDGNGFVGINFLHDEDPFQLII